MSEAKDTELIGSEGRAARTEPNLPPVSIRRGLRLRLRVHGVLLSAL